MSTPDVKTLDENYELLKATVTSCDVDYEKFTARQVKVSATRIRARLLVIKKLCDAIRKQLLAELALIPVKTRVKKPPATPPVSDSEGTEDDDDEKKDATAKKQRVGGAPPVGELPTEADAIKYADKYAAVDLMGTKTVMLTTAETQKELALQEEKDNEMIAQAVKEVTKAPKKKKGKKKKAK